MNEHRRKILPRQRGVAAAPWDTKGLKRVSKADRVKISLASVSNRFRRRQGDLREQAKVGPGCCKRCGSEPCGGGWGVMFGEHSARCCSDCQHPPLPGWKPTHVIWYDKKAFFVREVPIGKTGAMYRRQDGVCWFSRIADKHYFLGVELSNVEFARFKVSDPHGWPAGVKGSDMGLHISEEAGDIEEGEDEPVEAEDDEVEDDDDEAEEDEDDDGEDDPEDDEDSDGIEEEDEDEDSDAEDGEEDDAEDADDGEG